MPSDDGIMMLIEASVYRMLLRSLQSVELYWMSEWLLTLKGPLSGQKV